MRLYSVALVACTAAMLSSDTESVRTFSISLQKVNIPANVLSSDNSHDGVPAKQLLRKHVATASEERMPVLTDRPDGKMSKAVARLIRATYKNDPAMDDLAEAGARQRPRFDRIAIEQYLKFEARGETPQQLLFRLQDAIDAAKKEPNGRSDLVEAAREFYRKKMMAADIIYRKMIQAELHPQDVIRMIISAFQENGCRSNLVLKHLEKYIDRYNASRGTAITLRETLVEGTGDVAELASFLSVLKRIPVNAGHVQNVQQMLFEDWIQRLKTVDDVADMLRIQTQGDVVLAHQNMDTLVGYIAELAKRFPNAHREIVELLRQRFGDRQAAMVIERVNEVNSS